MCFEFPMSLGFWSLLPSFWVPRVLGDLGFAMPSWVTQCRALQLTLQLHWKWSPLSHSTYKLSSMNYKPYPFLLLLLHLSVSMFTHANHFFSWPSPIDNSPSLAALVRLFIYQALSTGFSSHSDWIWILFFSYQPPTPSSCLDLITEYFDLQI